MKTVDFEKLADQYAGFLVAVGGVSITVLALILGIANEPEDLVQRQVRLFLVAALVVAAVCCFVGAHMMAETAAFFSHLKCSPLEEESHAGASLGQRLFVLATANIFVGLTLVLFAVVLVPKATGAVDLTQRITPISCAVFLSVAGGALVWMLFAGAARTVAVGRDACDAIIGACVVGGGSGLRLMWLPMDDLAKAIFISIVLLTFFAVLYFAFIFRWGKTCSRTHCFLEMLVFTAGIAFSNTSLVVAYFKIW